MLTGFYDKKKANNNGKNEMNELNECQYQSSA